ncbi:MAG TPA: DUF711 family protein [Steroidobacteraceae bacterium]|nr:DUF711 family protein [Steroidobacteraceae bacterium]
MPGISRRDALTILAGTAIGVPAAAAAAESISQANAIRGAPRLRVRALTAGAPMKSAADTGSVEAALHFLRGAKRRVEAAGYEVQTTRVALSPLLLDASPAARDAAIPRLAALDRLAAGQKAVLALGPVFAAGRPDDAMGAWARQLIEETRVTSFSIAVASPARGVHVDAVKMSAAVISALSRALPRGVANFRFAAAACVPAGTPFFPVAYHEGDPAFAVGLESANLVADAFADIRDVRKASGRLRGLLNAQLAPIERIARASAQDGKRRYLGIDSSPAPGADSSIGRALEVLMGQPFGAASTLQACAAVTEAIKSLDVETCGYCGLMLPVLEDPVLAARAAEGRITLNELLLYSSVCGTGLDVVPLPGDATPDALARVIGDVATLAARLKKPLSARLFPVPGKTAGDLVNFDDPLLFASKVLPIEP